MSKIDWRLEKAEMVPSAPLEKYDELYQNETVSGGAEQGFAVQVKPVQLCGWPTDLRQAIVYLARPGGCLLEIGCGDGEVLAALSPGFDKVIGTELSLVRAKRTSRGLAHLPNCVILNEPLERLPVVIKSPFDCIVWADVIEHVVDVIGAMRILASLSRPGTQLVTVTPNVALWIHRVRLLFGRAPTTSTRCPAEGFAVDPAQTVLHDAGHLHYFTFSQIEKLYRLAGFQPERRLGIASRFSRWRNYWPTLLSSSVCVSGTFQGQVV